MKFTYNFKNWLKIKKKYFPHTRDNALWTSPPVLQFGGSQSDTEKGSSTVLSVSKISAVFFYTNNYAYTYKKLEKCLIREHRKIYIVKLQILR